MAPSSHSSYAKDEKVLCFHHELLYEAKILDSRPLDPSDKRSPLQYKVHYKGWKNTWDDWVPQDRLKKFNDENRELATNLKKEMEALRPRTTHKATSSKKKAIGSDLSSTRGSEDRHSSVQAPTASRGQKRGRDLEIEKVCKRARIVKSDLSNSTSEDHLPSPTPGEESSPLSSLSSLSSNTNPADTNPADSNPRPTNVARRTRNSTKDEVQAPDLRTGLEILACPPPLDPRRGNKYRCNGDTYHMLRDPNEFYSERGYRHPQLHKVLQKSNRPDLTAAGPVFFQDQDPRLLLMIAGYSADSLHKLRRNHKLTNNSNCQEESFHARPSVRLVIPDHLKALLVDDWENVTKNLQLVPLPSKSPANAILTTYFDEEKGKRRLGSAEADILEEVVQGIKEYFDKCLGRILLYRFEREQYFEIRQLWESGEGEWEGKGPGDVYGAEHLCRLFVSMPELIAQTNMDQQSVNKLRDELVKITQWLGKNSSRFFASDYENASQEYIEKARGV
ncbi:MAG: Esa1p-associated factor [Candelina submexicana]|nr:MAG: Esa1p-associated factor [Candelina submexicana]